MVMRGISSDCDGESSLCEAECLPPIADNWLNSPSPPSFGECRSATKLPSSLPEYFTLLLAVRR